MWFAPFQPSSKRRWIVRSFPRLLYYSGMRLSYRMIWALPTTYVNWIFTTFYHEKRTCYNRLLQSYCVDLRCLSYWKKGERKSCFEVGILFLALTRKQDLTVVLFKRNTLLPGRASLCSFKGTKRLYSEKTRVSISFSMFCAEFRTKSKWSFFFLSAYVLLIPAEPN